MPLQTGAMLVALALGGNALAHPNIENAPFGENYDNYAASSYAAIATVDDRKEAGVDTALSQDSFRPTEQVAPARLERSVSYVSATGDMRATSKADETGNLEDGRRALHPSTPDTAAQLTNGAAALHVVFDGTAILTGGWLSSGQYVLTFNLNARN
ncbi:hypothetical protein [Burkholderia sp. Ac-20365]|uniref:hypothetical protein n=1 Tax=Burkholderia sp. Ac-20365 TaxID=2703897 RepID=UPI00197C4AF3|nr:hypothetical protein [Burkholderia sp. Ac-20365]